MSRFYDLETSLTQSRPVVVVEIYRMTHRGSFLPPLQSLWKSFKDDETPVQVSALTDSGSTDDAVIDIDIPKDEDILTAFRSMPAPNMYRIQVRLRQEDETGVTENIVIHRGVISSFQETETNITIKSASILQRVQRPGLRNNYQVLCPYVFQDSLCKKGWQTPSVAINESSLVSVDGVTLTVNPSWFDSFPPEVTSSDVTQGLLTAFRSQSPSVTPDMFIGVRTVVSLSEDKTQLKINYPFPEDPRSIRVSLGCHKTRDYCSRIHDNIHRYGGTPWAPKINPHRGGWVLE